MLAALGLVMCGVKAAQRVAAAPMRTSARKRGAPFVACVSSHWATGRSWSTWSGVRTGDRVKAEQLDFGATVVRQGGGKAGQGSEGE